MIFEVGTVLALVIIRAVAAEIIALVIEALGPILARVGLAIIYVQLSVMAEREERREDLSQRLYSSSSHGHRKEMWNLTFFYLPPLLPVHARHNAALTSLAKMLSNSMQRLGRH